ncbi:MAG: porin [Pseudomonadota bacterium]|jgi:predicted porin|uniref:Outer membrane protein (Porin) n=1 Tax=Caballeronia sordidicola TaxID=196367 RepID=A0A242M6K3_CABSO|nr:MULTISPECIES: porin [Burkholderiaceae]AME24613.1 porin [Burkholderia sp. PAMC 26561]AMM13833.1 porin [Burkholderia sp. PAMC 28687]MDP9155030.1 porin [Pseudomonadota bacterium]OTP66828.1 Outer membrane protein (porin) [Caballeronia sordidicola]
MKKIALSALSLTLFGMTGAAYAQSSVTLYGTIDAGVGYVKTSSGARWGFIDGTLSGDRWGLKGSEDLGGGLKAIFDLENGFDIANGTLGQGGKEFGRQAFVGLTGDSWGTATIGRQYDPLVDMVQPITEDNYFGSAFATPGDVDNYDNSLRVSNALKYVSPNFAGLQFEGLYAFSGLAGRTGQGYTYSGAVTYNNGPLGIAGGYFLATNPNPTAGAFRDGWDPTSSSDAIFDGAINTGYATAKSLGIARGAIQYAIGSFTVGASYSNAQYKNDGASTFASTEKFNIGSAFVNYQMTPAMLLGAGYTYTKASGDTSAKYHQASLGADYSVSKRTDFYAVAAYQHASGTQLNPDGTTQNAQASIGSYGFNGTASQELVILGMRHKF